MSWQIWTRLCNLTGWKASLPFCGRGCKLATRLRGKECELKESQFKAILGSSDWTPIVESMTDALTLMTEPQKKTRTKKAKD